MTNYWKRKQVLHVEVTSDDGMDVFPGVWFFCTVALVIWEIFIIVRLIHEIMVPRIATIVVIICVVISGCTAESVTESLPSVEEKETISEDNYEFFTFQVTQRPPIYNFSVQNPTQDSGPETLEYYSVITTNKSANEFDIKSGSTGNRTANARKFVNNTNFSTEYLILYHRYPGSIRHQIFKISQSGGILTVTIGITNVGIGSGVVVFSATIIRVDKEDRIVPNRVIFNRQNKQ